MRPTAAAEPPRAAGLAWRALAVLAMAVALYAVPLALADRVDPRLSLLALLAIDALLVAVVAGSRGALKVAAGLLALLALSALGREIGGFALPSVLTFGAIAAGFAWTLRPGATPLVTAIARQVHGAATDGALERYTRGLTAAWAAGFALLAAASALLALHASFETWTLVVNLLSWPLIGAGFVLEWALRRIGFPALPASTPVQVVGAVLRYAAGGGPARRPGGPAVGR
jgi:uncharacterized membrane protein